MNHYIKHIFICTNQKAAGKKCCATAGADEYFDYMKSKLLEMDMHGPGKIRVSKSGCLGRCSLGPCIVVYPDGVWYNYSSFKDIDEIIHHHLLEGHLVKRLLIS
ncbi:(2Fe-2S) ferredoxin domain-containing protein [Legionella israelensis]|uniref:(2Fe-2S) ferredoxin domain-containing protein n=1 Tax=Legionella israelensis TaxID=454 RepID=A0A0W0V319_9GAMM|nr:NAD(P)H-dependent oxidoreductase subunit E [Legionella israelensis]KTD14230.1 ferredoxin 2Fe-2S protein [Legionella israelensis]QBR85020.1 (2Fe-2S) ferredoxin domain-containing protein [Legionella israelensis]QBS10088.1 (2Fe-2S) ferredoxin domain-containing protein [Legionella israelensis]QDP71100.1 (2Fe-2S) ferredoxin domain-containing protein [Legionella israelensis]SCX97173.1 (2Fe-2S) ferredoxin [Legionella israelensis DSM 19235]